MAFDMTRWMAEQWSPLWPAERRNQWLKDRAATWYQTQEYKDMMAEKWKAAREAQAAAATPAPEPTPPPPVPVPPRMHPDENRPERPKKVQVDRRGRGEKQPKRRKPKNWKV